MSNRYLVVIEPTENNYSANAPDLPGCIATGDTIKETLDRMQDAITIHVSGLTEDGGRAPEPAATADYIEVEL